MSEVVCPFCSIPHDQILFSNLHGVVFRDESAGAPGCTLISPRRHINSFFELSTEERNALFALLEEAKRRLDKEIKPTGYNIGFDELVPSGEIARHLHIYLIPR